MQHLFLAGPAQRVHPVEQSSIIQPNVYYHGQTLKLNANLDDNGSVLLKQIKATVGANNLKIQIHSRGRVFILDERLTLRDYLLQSGDTIMVVDIVCGGGGFSFPPLSFNKLENTIFQKFSSEAPNWRIVTSGLNLRGRCKKVGCDAYDQIVWIQGGLGKFLIRQLVSKKAQCPICHSKADEVDNLGFSNCNYRIEGSLSESEDEIAPITGKTEEGHLTTFKSGETAAWDFIEITTTKLN